MECTKKVSSDIAYFMEECPGLTKRFYLGARVLESLVKENPKIMRL